MQIESSPPTHWTFDEHQTSSPLCDSKWTEMHKTCIMEDKGELNDTRLVVFTEIGKHCSEVLREIFPIFLSLSVTSIETLITDTMRQSRAGWAHHRLAMARIYRDIEHRTRYNNNSRSILATNRPITCTRWALISTPA